MAHRATRRSATIYVLEYDRGGVQTENSKLAVEVVERHNVRKGRPRNERLSRHRLEGSHINQERVVADCFQRMERRLLVIDRQSSGLQMSQKVYRLHRGLRIWIQRKWGHRMERK